MKKQYKIKSFFRFLENDPEPDVPKGLTPMPQYAFKTFMLKVSAVRTNYRSLLRSSSIHEPSDPPVRLEYLFRF